MSKADKFALLLEAIEHGKPHIVKTIIEEGEIDINTDPDPTSGDNLQVPPRDIDKEGYNLAIPPPVTFVPALSWAVFNGKINATHYLVEKAGAKLNSTSTDGRTALHTAISKGFTELTTYLLDRGADVNCVNHAGETPLYFAAHFGHDALFSKLTDHPNIVLSVLTDNKFSVLHMAASKGNVDMVKFLLDKCPTLATAVADNGHSPLSLAARHGHEDVVAILSQFLADHPDTDPEESDLVRRSIDIALPSLVRAPTRAHTGILRTFIESPFTQYSKEFDGGRSKKEQLSLLLKEAALNNNAIAIPIIMQSHADINFQDKQGQTALHHACIHGHKTIVVALVGIDGIDLDIEDDDDYTAMTYADLGDFGDIVDYLTSKGAKEGF